MSDIAQELEALMERVNGLDKQRRYKSMLPLLREGLDRSREARDFDWYVSFLFEKMRNGSSNGYPELEREAAVEMISLLESEEAARRICPNLDAESYEGARFWYSSCAYDRLAGATMTMQGCNSEGMYGAIDAGVEVCNRTGKTRCIVCFRENGVDSSIAADDLDLATNQALWLAHRNQEDVQHDRRVLGWRRVALINMLEGDPRTALRALEPAWEAAAEFHDPEDARRTIHRTYESACILLGEPQEYEKWAKDHPRPASGPRGECGDDDADDDCVAALRAAAAGDFKRVEELLAPLLAELDRRKHLMGWFDVARQLYASRIVAGNGAAAEELAEEMLRRAKPARQWFIERIVRVHRMPDFTANPFGTALPLLEGPWKDKTARPDEPAEAQAPPPPEAPSEAPQNQPDERTDFERRVDDWLDRLQAAEDPAPVLDEIEPELLKIDPMKLTSARDATEWLRAGTWLAREGRAAAELWRRANRLRRKFGDDAAVLATAADIGDLLRLCEGEVDIRPEPDELDAIYRQALALDPNHARAHFSAGRFYEDSGNLSEAERCFARAFRLNRAASVPAMAIARVYRNTERPRDALEALDVAIRYGCEDSRVFWEAMVDAYGLGMWERCLSYGHALAEGTPDAGGVRYYMALASLELEEWQRAIELIDKEAELEPASKLQVHAVRALALAGLKKRKQAKAELQAALDIPLPQVDYMSPRGLVVMHTLLIRAARALKDAEAEAAVMRRARRAGILADEFFEEYRLREDNPESENLHIYEVYVKQKLPKKYANDTDTPPWARDWGSYLVRWVVLAEDEDAAAEFALEQQRQAADMTPKVDRIEQQDGDYTGKPGVVEESAREGTPHEQK